MVFRELGVLNCRLALRMLDWRELDCSPPLFEVSLVEIVRDVRDGIEVSELVAVELLVEFRWATLPTLFGNDAPAWSARNWGGFALWRF